VEDGLLGEGTFIKVSAVQLGEVFFFKVGGGWWWWGYMCLILHDMFDMDLELHSQCSPEVR